jgi:hypothetical protein
MNVVYSSPHYHVVEYPNLNGFELINNRAGLGIFIRGDIASAFRASMKGLVAQHAGADEMDEVVGGFDPLMQPLNYH